MTLLSLLALLAVAAVCGGIGQAIAGRGSRSGCLASIALGFIGALLGNWLSRELRLPEPLRVVVGGHRFPVLWSIIGAALFVAVVHLISGGRRGGD